MPCCALLLLLFVGPRIVLLALALFTHYLGRAFHGELLLPLIGWLFLPWTTLAYAWTMNSYGDLSGFHGVLIAIALLVDLGVLGGGAAKRKNKGA